MRRSPIIRRVGLPPSKRLSTKSARRLASDLELADQMPALFARSNGRCEARLFGCTGQGHHAHHRKRRSQGGRHDLDNLLWVCWSCHRTIHDFPEMAHQAGLLMRSWEAS